MTFYPTQGTASTEEFDSSEGAIFLNPTLQGITPGGYLTLLNKVTGVFDVGLRTWTPVNSWTISNNLYNLDTLTGTFAVVTGAVSGQVNTVIGTFDLGPQSNAWNINTSTNYPTSISGFGFSGAGSYFFYLGSGSPNKQLYGSIVSGSQATTFEFDVASYVPYSGLDTLAGFSTTQNNLTGLPALSGLVGHGLLYSNGVSWDFIEITPYGIRSLNHPEIAIPENFLDPKRVRVGFKGYDLYISLQGGKSVAGLGKFDTPVFSSNQIFAAFGSVTSGSVISTSTNKVMNSIKASYGNTSWDNIKVLTGQLTIYSQSNENYYSTGFTTMYTSEFNPGVAITNYTNAYIKYLPYRGGITEVTAQYSGSISFIDYSTVSLTGNGYSTIDLSSFPINTYGRENFTSDYFKNPIRFKIRQRSLVGNQLPPSVDSISIFANKERFNVDLVPDWKTEDSYTTIKANIVTGTILTEDPVPEKWSSFLINIPYTTGYATGVAFNDEKSNYNVTVRGTGEFLLEGPYRSCYKNYTEGTLTAISGSAAYLQLGAEPVRNIFPNPLFENGFREVTTGESNYYTGLTEGELAASTRISNIYTGIYKVDYLKERIYRPEAQARVAKINSYLGNPATQLEEFVQTVNVYPGGPTHNGRVGIEAVIPSGIATGNLLISFDVKIAEGSGIALSCIGSTTGNYILPGDYFRDFSTVTVTATTSNTNQYLLRFNVPSGYNADSYKYSIDNIIVGRYLTSHLTMTGVEPALHSIGISPVATSGSIESEDSVDRTSTILYGSIYLDSYPTQTGTFVSVINQALNKGIRLEIDTLGRLISKVDYVSSSWFDVPGDVVPINYPTDTLISEQTVPLGRWTNIAFYHDVHTFRNYSNPSIRDGGTTVAANFASTNKSYLCIDGYPVASKDVISGWRDNTTLTTFINNDSKPFVTYAQLGWPCNVVVASGLMCKVDGIHLLRPPAGELETEITIKGARAYAPYFTPDFLYKGNDEENNLLYNGPSNPIPHSKDLFIGSCYNFSSPGYINFDKGPLRNHLMVYGSPIKENSNPYGYPDIYSTRFNNSFAIAPYSSSYERLQTNYNATIPVIPFTPIATLPYLSNNAIQAFGWIYPRTTGSLFTAYQNYNQQTGSRIEAAISTGNRFVINKYGSTNNLLFTVTGHQVNLNEWDFVSFRFRSTGYFANLNTGVVTCQISDGVSITSDSLIRTGIDFGFIYQGVSGSPGQSAMRFGGTSDCNFFNWALPIVASGDNDIIRNYISSGDKSGRYQAIVLDQTLFTGNVTCPSYNEVKFNLGPMDPGEYNYSLAINNAYDTIPSLQGMVAYDNKPFKVIDTYNLNYDFTKVESVFGAKDSPIRIGNTVPPNAINIAKISSPEYSVESSISTIDLSDRNPNNLNVYRQGTYLVGSRSQAVTSQISTYKGINSAVYAGRQDLTISGQVVSSDIGVSTISISNPNSDFGYQAYYYYLVGRGDKGIKVPGTFPHYTGQILEFSTGAVPDAYIANLEKIKNSISLRDRKGNFIPFDAYPYDISISPYPVNALELAVASGLPIPLDNIGVTYLSGSALPTNVFTVILLTATNNFDGESVFIHYDAYDYVNKSDLISYKEIVNPQPIFRERQPGEEVGIGKYDLLLNQEGYYDLKVYGIASGYNGKL
jgi:hypothetical protein